MGGKSRLVKTIIPMIPTDHTCYVEPFCGAGWVFFGKYPVKAEILNDADGELVNFWRVIQNHLVEFIRHFQWILVSREHFENENKKDPATLTDIQRAVRYYYLQKLGFGGKTHKRTFGTSTTSRPRINFANMESILLEAKYRLETVNLEHLDACDCIRRYDRPATFFYIDPPYWKTAGYANPFTPEMYDELRDTLASIKGRFILSLNDHKDVRRIFKQFKIKRVVTSYSVANPRTAASKRGASVGEVIIRNF